jgi:hypothetical protein
MNQRDLNELKMIVNEMAKEDAKSESYADRRKRLIYLIDQAISELESTSAAAITHEMTNKELAA